MSNVLRYLEGRDDIPEPTLSSLRALARLDAAGPLPDAETYAITGPQQLTDEARHRLVMAWRESMPGKRLVVLGGGMTIAPLFHLDAAWAEAAAASEAFGAHLEGLFRADEDWEAVVSFDFGLARRLRAGEWKSHGDTPAIALQTLAARLRAAALESVTESVTDRPGGSAQSGEK